MKIELAKHSGFCDGVRDAVLKIAGVLNDNSNEGEILMYGPLIHNPQTVEILESRGLATVKKLDGIDGRVVGIRTHGVTQSTFKEIKGRAKKVINLTCPKVARVQAFVKKYSREGYHIIVLGDRDHAEVVSVTSYASGGFTVVSGMDEIKDIPSGGKYLLVSQTTLDKCFFSDAVQAISRIHPDITIIDTICESTHNRQNDLTDAIERGIDALVVVGGRESANTARLARIGEEHGIKTFHIETEKELRDSDFIGTKHVLVTAGASTPGWIINSVIEKLHAINYQNSGRVMGFLKNFFELLTRMNIISTITTFFFGSMLMKGSGCLHEPRLPLLSAIIFFLMYSVNYYFQRKRLSISNPFRARLYGNYGVSLLAINALLFVFSLYIAFQFFGIISAYYGFLMCAGALYSMPLQRRIINLIPFRTVRKTLQIKSIITTLGWGMICALPLFYDNCSVLEFFLLLCAGCMVLFLRNLLVELIAFQGDIILGVNSFPTWIGVSGVKIAGYIASLTAAGLLAAYSVLTGHYGIMILILFCSAYNFLIFKLIHIQYFNSLSFELLADLGLIGFVAAYLII